MRFPLHSILFDFSNQKLTQKDTVLIYNAEMDSNWSIAYHFLAGVGSASKDKPYR